MRIRYLTVMSLFVLLPACAIAQGEKASDDLCPKPLSIPEASCPLATLKTVKPPKGNPRVTPFFISEKALDALPEPQQPKALAERLAALDTGSIDERVAKLKAKALADLVFVKGGTFTMGDFTPLLKIPGITRMTYNEDDKHLHDVTLSDFYISRYKATYAELNVFTDATGAPRLAKDEEANDRFPTVPAGMYWQTAKDYCQWLGKLTGHHFDLPTEAQWEYAARSRGQFFMIPTDDGNIDYGRNVPYEAQAERLWPDSRIWHYAIGLFPPNPLGLYDMQYNGVEWVNDWYAGDAYEKSASVDPKGPDSGERKVIRGWSSDSLKIGVAVWRRSEPPKGHMVNLAGVSFRAPDRAMPTVRCVTAP